MIHEIQKISMAPDEVERLSAALDNMSRRELQKEFARVWGEETYSHNCTLMRRRIRWRYRCLAGGGLSHTAVLKVQELADLTRVRDRAPHSRCGQTQIDIYSLSPEGEARRVENPAPEQRLVHPGAFVKKSYKGKEYIVYALSGNRFSCNGVIFDSLTAVAKHIAGYQVSGNRFFNSKSIFSA